MPVGVEIELDWRGKRYQDIERGLRAIEKNSLNSFENMTPIIKKLLEDYMKGVVKSVQNRASVPYPHGTSRAGVKPGTLSRRSGKLFTSLRPGKIVTRGQTVDDLEVSFKLTGIANVHERGAVVRPRRARYLTIPLPAALDSRGVPLRPRARDWNNTFIQRSKKGNLLIFLKQPNGNIVPLYALKKSVVIPPRLNFEEAFLAGQDFLADAIADQVIKEFF